MEEKISKRKFLIVFSFIAFSAVAFPVMVQAANLYFSPSAGSYAVGSAFSVSIYAASADQAMNAASGIVSFPSDKLQVVSLSKTGSAISLWVQEPSFSNSAGTIDFEGVVPNPGFTGSAGKIVTVDFKIKATGPASILFSSGSVLANDGKGTDILANLGRATFTFGSAVQGSGVETATPKQTTGTPSSPRITSSTHPESEKWYAEKNAKFSWFVPADVTVVRALVDKNPRNVPTVVYSPPVSEREIKDLEDGVWYFHAQFRNAKGWGGTAHFKFRVDTTPPKQFTVTFPHGVRSDDPRPVAFFRTTDALSGLSHYEAKIGEKDLLRIDPREIESNPYAVPPQPPGRKTIIVKAFDQASNEAVAVAEFEVEPLQAPEFTLYQKMIDTREIFIAEGETYPDAMVAVSIKNERGEMESRETRSNNAGSFQIIWPKPLAEGIYTFSARVTDNRDAKSLESLPLTFSVESPRFLMIGGRVVTVLATIVPLVVLVLVLIFVIWYGSHRLLSFRKKVRKEIHNAEQTLHRAFDLLKEAVRTQIKMLEGVRNKRELTVEEEKILRQLEKDLDNAERLVKKGDRRY